MNDSRPHKTRWYHLTPDRLLIGLLLAVGVLFLSEWFVWFSFNEKKGWTVLIALGSVCGALLFLGLWFIVALVFRRRFQFSIRSLLVLVLVCAVVCSWLAVRMKEAQRQCEAVAAIRERGGYLRYTSVFGTSNLAPNPQASVPAWLVNLLGVDFFEGVSSADCAPDFDDEDMVYLSRLANLQSLNLSGTQVTDSGLEHLKGLPKLEKLFLPGTQVTDSGLEHLKGLAKLRVLSLGATQVTDSGLEHLKGLAKLQFLDLGGTQVTDSGLEDLKGLANLQWLGLSGTQVTDSGLEHVKGLAKLGVLSLDGTHVTKEGIKKLQQALPGCEIQH